MRDTFSYQPNLGQYLVNYALHIEKMSQTKIKKAIEQGFKDMKQVIDGGLEKTHTQSEEMIKWTFVMAISTELLAIATFLLDFFTFILILVTWFKP